MTIWRILSSGPSIADLDELPGEGPIVAVNHAILHDSIQADYWCVHEYTRGIENELVNVAEGPRLDTWVGRGHLGKWFSRLLYRREHGLPPLRPRPHPQDDRHWCEVLGWGGSKVRWGVTTFNSAVACCIERGAEQIDLFGVDLVGDRHYGGGPASALIRANVDKATGGTSHNRPDRWEFEKNQLRLITEECHARGILVRRL